MSHTRTRSTTNTSNPSDPHPISLKVLRLSRPSLAAQTPLPPPSSQAETDLTETNNIPPSASLAYPSAAPQPPTKKAPETEHPSATFPLTPLLTLPPAFGAAYVGEVFGCALCVNDESDHTASETERKRQVSDVRVEARLQTPGQREGVELELLGEGEGEGFAEGGIGTLQRVLKCELREEGAHVLAVTVVYTEGEGRTRSFRKLYQFVAQQLVAVRSKVTAVKKRAPEEGRVKWILEAQLQNVGESSVVLEKVWLEEREGLVGKAVNGAVEGREATVLKPQDVEQVMWLLEAGEEFGEEGARVPLAKLNLDWRGAMGEKGSLTTGWLATRAR